MFDFVANNLSFVVTFVPMTHTIYGIVGDYSVQFIVFKL